MSRVIIAIHGLGNKPMARLLEKWWWNAISEGLKKHTKNLYHKPLFKLVYWADVLYDRPKDANITDPEDKYYIDEPYLPEIVPAAIKDHSIRKKIMDSIVDELNKVFLNDDYSLNFSGLNDLVIKKYFRDLDAYYSDVTDGKYQPVRETLRNRLKNVLSEHKNDEILLIAHSMGSIIAFDVLALFKNEVKIDTLITIGSPLGLPVVVSKIAKELDIKNRLAEKLKAPSSITNHWYNFSDLEDKIAFNYKLNDDFSENLNGIKVTDFIVTNNYTSNGHSNPHKSYGYLRTPEVAEKIYEFLTKEPLTFHDRISYFFRRFLSRQEPVSAK